MSLLFANFSTDRESFGPDCRLKSDLNWLWTGSGLDWSQHNGGGLKKEVNRTKLDEAGWSVGGRSSQDLYFCRYVLNMHLLLKHVIGIAHDNSGSAMQSVLKRSDFLMVINGVLWLDYGMICCRFFRKNWTLISQIYS